MKLATRRLHALDNVAPLTFPVCDVCDKAIMTQPYEADGKSYHQGGCLIELGHRVTEQVWKAKEAARIAAAEQAKMYEKPAYHPPVTYQPFTTIDSTSPFVVGGVGTSIPAGWVVGGGAGGNISGHVNNGTVALEGNTIFLPTSVVTTGGQLLSSLPVGVFSTTASASRVTSSTSTTFPATSFVMEGAWDTPVPLYNGDAIEFTATVNL